MNLPEMREKLTNKNYPICIIQRDFYGREIRELEIGPGV